MNLKKLGKTIMSNISAELIKELRSLTGVGMSKCKEALSASSGNIQEAISYLRKKGMASGAKKEGRETKEGFVAFKEEGDLLAIVEVNAETDFVVQNERFKEFSQDVVEQILQNKPSSLEELLQQKYEKDPTLTIDQYRNLVIQSLGENIQVKKMELIKKAPQTSLGIYSHMGGKILAIVEITGSDKRQDLAKEVAMHAAAYNPDFLKPEDVSEEAKQREEDIARSQMQGKPENMMAKIIAGKMQAYYKESCLTKQAFVKDPSLSVEKYVEKKGKENGETLHISRFWRWKVGQ